MSSCTVCEIARMHAHEREKESARKKGRARARTREGESESERGRKRERVFGVRGSLLSRLLSACVLALWQ